MWQKTRWSSAQPSTASKKNNFHLFAYLEVNISFAFLWYFVILDVHRWCSSTTTCWMLTWKRKILSRFFFSLPLCYHIYGPYGWCRFNANQTQIPPPPPPYQQPPSYALHAPVPQAAYGMVHPNQCPIHRMQQCTCLHMTNNEVSSTDCLCGSGSSNPAFTLVAEYVARFRNRNVAVVSAQRSESRPVGKL